MGVAVGVDSHKKSFAAAVVDDVGRDLGVREFPNNSKGYDRALRWITGFDLDVVGIEGSGHYGAGLTRALVDAGILVKEVPPFLTARERNRAPSQGKSDPADARAIARTTLRGEGLCDPVHDGPNADLKLLVDHRDQLIRARQRVANRTHALLAHNYPGYEGKVARLSTKKGIRAARAIIDTSAASSSPALGESRTLGEGAPDATTSD